MRFFSLIGYQHALYIAHHASLKQMLFEFSTTANQVASSDALAGDEYYWPAIALSK